MGLWSPGGRGCDKEEVEVLCGAQVLRVEEGEEGQLMKEHGVGDF